MSASSDNSTVDPVSTEKTPVSVPTVKSVLAELSAEGGSRETSGFDVLVPKDRNVVRKAIEARFDHFMRDGKFDAAKPVWALLGSLKGTVTVKVETDPRAAIAEKVAILRYAADALFAGSVPVGGIDTDMPILDESDIPEVTDEMVEKALKFATFSIGAKTKVNDIPSLIRSVFANRDNGDFLKVSEIRTLIGTINGISVDSSWDGRINASLFPKDKSGNLLNTKVAGIVAIPSGTDYADNKGRAGAYRVESDSWDN